MSIYINASFHGLTILIRKSRFLCIIFCNLVLGDGTKKKGDLGMFDLMLKSQSPQ